ncbi:DUF418 domain-containing protein [Pseudolysinimonas sp.]|uniref:DUF418 domain-containing protein n=1 Tax=Pseudolysinimonas sp. TaxID=2680009 RepID=UPI00286BCAAE|nr:DUF418 domain-containing protein [Pseudolysinimonas sp.]
MTATFVAPRPAALTGRVVAPDLARGVLLLFIAIANAPFYLWGQASGMVSAHPPGASGADLVVQTISLFAIDGRSYPMFAFLFGYGIWQLYRRQAEAGVDQHTARRLLRRRHLWMIAFGALHAALLWMGDVIGAYGLAGLVIVAIFLDRRDFILKLCAGILLGLVALNAIAASVGAAMVAAFVPPETLDLGEFDIRFAQAEPSYLISMALRFGMWLAVTGLQLFAFIIPIAILIALVAARAGVLEEPEKHLPLLRRTAVGGIAIAWGFGAIVALQNAGVFGIPSFYDWAFAGFNSIAGLCGALGYVAVFGLIAARVRTRPPGLVRGALEALGKRSLSGYLAQSVVFAPLMSAWGLGLGAQLSSWTIALIAVATWLVTVVLAAVLERAGKRGPAEWALRRLAYPRRPSS